MKYIKTIWVRLLKLKSVIFRWLEISVHIFRKMHKPFLRTCVDKILSSNGGQTDRQADGQTDGHSETNIHPNILCGEKTTYEIERTMKYISYFEIWHACSLKSIRVCRERVMVYLGQSKTHFLAGFFNEKCRLIDWRWSVWRAGGRPQLG